MAGIGPAMRSIESVGEAGALNLWPTTGSGDCLLTLREVAARLRCSVKTVRRLISAGLLESFKVGGGRRVTVAALAAYLERQGMGSLCHA